MHRPGRIRSERWRDIAVLCREEALTVPAIAKRLGVEPGSIQALVGSMRRENLLEPAESEARGVALKLSRQGRKELEKHETAGGVEGPLPADERLVFVIDEGRGVSADTLASLAEEPTFRWAARVDGPVRWIASFGTGDAVAAERAANALAETGARAVVGRTDEFFDADGLLAFAKRLTGQKAINARRR